MKLARPAFWAKKGTVSYVLWPVSLIFVVLSKLRRLLFRVGIKASWRSPVPVVVVGNITVGGAGKTPLVIALCELLTRAGFNVGVVTRGYGGEVNSPMIAMGDSDASVVGDEAVLIARRTGVPVAVFADRVVAVKALTSHQQVDCILSDDGLQHYALKRDVEIAVVDSAYQFGNGFCLPAGPLRESVKRLSRVDFTVYSGVDRTASGYSLVGSELVNLSDHDDKKPLQEFAGTKVHAVAAIASPENFFESLQSLGIGVIPHSFGDHAVLVESDLQFGDGLPVVMTEKDMVKCQRFSVPNVWYLPVSACIDDDLEERIVSRIVRVIEEKKNDAE